MKKYILEFTGRTKGAIGIFYKIQAVVIAENIETATLKLYDHYEHIKFVKEINEKQIKTSLMNMISRLLLIDVNCIGEYKDGAENCFLEYKGKKIQRPSYDKIASKIKKEFNLILK